VIGIRNWIQVIHINELDNNVVLKSNSTKRIGNTMMTGNENRIAFSTILLSTLMYNTCPRAYVQQHHISFTGAKAIKQNIAYESSPLTKFFTGPNSNSAIDI
jgi:hypothetical protein